ncbi:MAG: hypothetical protein AAGI17_10340 [Planctomycetota bacterium]
MTATADHTPHAENAQRRAGQPGKRGSALLVTVGALAIVSVFAAVYISIGQGDRRLAEGVTEEQEVRTVETAVSRYLAQVIAQDLFDTFPERFLGTQQGQIATNRARLRRENIDFPYTDFTRRSVQRNYNESIAANLAARFSPNGGHRFPFDTGTLFTDTGNDAPFRVADDPWLAATMPSYVNFLTGDDDQRYGRVYSRELANSVSVVQPLFWYLDNRDWWQISNFAPDGRFVNLYAMRDPDGDVFDAAPGIDLNTDADGLVGPEMSSFLSLLTTVGGNSSELRATLELPFNLGQSIVPGNVDGPINHPAWFTMFQKHMLMPDDPAFQIRDRFNQPATPSSPDYPDYQYADTDGDGLYDARWFELVDATAADADRAFSLLPQNDIRWVVAARAMDLSALVNVNTATDGLAGASGLIPPGATPSEVDLRRLLTAEDESIEYIGEPLHPARGGNAARSALSLAYIQPPSRLQINANPGEVIPEDYSNLNTYDIFNSDPGLYLASVPLMGGRFSYDALRRSIAGTSTLTNGTFPRITIGSRGLTGNNGQLLNISGALGVRLIDESPLEWGLLSPEVAIGRQFPSRTMRDVAGLDLGNNIKNVQFESEDRRRYYEATASSLDSVGNLTGLRLDAPIQPPVAPGLNPTSAPVGTNFFDNADLLELLTYWGVNDDQYVSRLESVLQARVAPTIGATFAPGNEPLRFSPLRSNRPTDLERRNHDNQNNLNYALNAESPDNRLDNESMALLTLDRRKLLTTRSGSLPITSRVVDLDQFGALVDPQLISTDARLPLESFFLNPRGAFNQYLGALAPGLSRLTFNVNEIQGDWDRQNTTDTLYYGHRGPELPVRIAAHMAVNLVDMYDDGSQPSVATVITDSNLNQSQRFRTGSSGGMAPARTAAELRDEPFHHWFNMQNQFRIEQEPGSGVQQPRTLSNGTLPPERQVYNVYGIEAHPIITEASVVAVYADAPGGTGSGLELSGNEMPLDVTTAASNNSVTDVVFVENPSLYTEYDPSLNSVKIDLTRDETNNELLFYAFAVQLHNPYDEPVQLNVIQNQDNDPPSARGYGYYLEFNGRFFPIASFQQAAPMAGDPPVSAVPSTGGTWPLLDDPMTGSIDETQVDQNGHTLQPHTSAVYWFTAHEELGALNQIWEDFTTGWNSENTDAPATFPGLAVLIDNLFGDPFNNNDLRFRTAMFNPRTGAFLSSPFEDFLLPPAAALSPEVRPTNSNGTNPSDNVSGGEFRLWRTHIATNLGNGDVTEPEFASNLSESAEENLWIENDQLVDRLVIPGGDIESALFDGRTGEVPVAGSVVIDGGTNTALELSGSNGVGFSAMYSVRRPTGTDPIFDDPNTVEISGIIPPWLLQVSTGESNEALPVDADPIASMSPNEFFGNFRDVSDNQPFAHLAFEDLTDSLGVPEIRSSIADEPWEKRTGGAAGASLETSIQYEPGSVDLTGAAGLQGLTLEQVNALFALPNDLFSTSGAATGAVFTGARSNARVTDLLLALGVGPSMRMNTLGASPRDLGAVEWTTTGEALAAVLGLEAPTFYDPMSADYEPFYGDLWEPGNGPNGSDLAILDNGHLHLDRWVPFLNADSDANLIFNPNPGTGGDQAVHPALPAALRVLDGVDGLPIAVRDLDNPTAGPFGEINLDLSDETFAARFQPGKININTAPLSVLRMLPGLSPALTPSLSGESQEWAMRAFSGSGISMSALGSFQDGQYRDAQNGFGANPPVPLTARPRDLAANFEATRPDLAAVLQGYRDRQAAQVRIASQVNDGMSIFHPGLNYGPLPFDVTQPTTFPVAGSGLNMFYTNFINEPIPDISLDYAVRVGRQQLSGARGLRATPGFSSPAEVLAASVMDEERYADITNGAPDESLRALRHLSMDYLGRDVSGVDPLAQHATGNDLGLNGLEGGVFGNATQTGLIPARAARRNIAVRDPAVIDDVANDIAEKLGIASGLLNVIDVRSDVYAVWFKIRGYRRSDVEGLDDDDLMTPSIERRYVMVIDRSNVTEPGEAPDILVFQEVPL